MGGGEGVSSADWPSIALAVGLVLVLLIASEMYRRLRPSRMSLSKQAKLLSWDEARTQAAKLSQTDLRNLRSNFYIGTADQAPVEGASLHFS